MPSRLPACQPPSVDTLAPCPTSAAQLFNSVQVAATVRTCAFRFTPTPTTPHQILPSHHTVAQLCAGGCRCAHMRLPPCAASRAWAAALGGR